MIDRIHRQLTIRNAAVLSVILIGLNLFVYVMMKEMLFGKIDESLRNTLNQMSVSVTPQKGILLSIGQWDRPIVQLFWTDDGQALPMPGRGAFTQEQLEQLKPEASSDNPRTLKVGEEYFREIHFDSAKMGTISILNGEQYGIAKLQVLINVSAEKSMLNRLQYIMLSGGTLGLIVAVAAGYYLANRSLIPIRRSLEQQQQFVSDASHELRTPLSVIQAHSELLLRHPEHTIEQDSKHISTVLREAKRMNKLVGSLLTLARTDAGRMELERKPVRFDSIVQESVAKMQMLAEVKEVILQADIDSPISMVADEERLHQLLITVLDNAIKYTPEGGVVRVSCRKLSHSVQLAVEDTGIGIAPDSLPYVFDRFYRADKSRSREDGGTGLGLAIAKWIVERHGGRIRLESNPSFGTQVYVTLPL